MTENILIKPSIKEEFRNFMDHERILCFSAPCGFGKTCVAEALLAEQVSTKRKILRLNPGEPDFAIPKSAEGWDILLIDDAQYINEDSDWQALCRVIRMSTNKKFIMLTRGAPEGCLMTFRYAGIMTVLRAEDLLFDSNDIRTVMHNSGIEISEVEAIEIKRISIGYPLGVIITARNITTSKDNNKLNKEIIARSFREVYLYFEEAIYKRFDLSVRRFLLELAPFKSFDTEMARVVTGDPHAGELLEYLLRNTTMLLYDDVGTYSFWPKFRDFLMWEMDREFSEEKKKATFVRGGLYYELKEDYANALECYTLGDDHSKASEILIRNSELHPGMGHYSEMAKYYKSMPEFEILASPALMQGMSMLCALYMDYDESERWYKELEDFYRRCSKHDAAGKQARSRLAWLDICLPQRGVAGLTSTIPAVFNLLRNKEVTLPGFSVTSTLPSIMNGGKDFSDWSKIDDLLYKTIRVPVETILGKDGVGLADCAIAESKFEKGEDISARMLNLIPRINEIRQKGTPDIEFAMTGLLARAQLANGQSEDAIRTIKTLRQDFEKRGLSRFMPNIDAMLCRMDLLIGNLNSAEEWYMRKSPRDPMNINVMKRYQYMTQSMVELALGKPDAALVTLAPLETNFRKCGRHIDNIHLKVLMAIAYYRKKDDAWREALAEALDIAEDYGFTRTISVYGSAVLPLLKDQNRQTMNSWYKALMAQVRTRAGLYPDFLQGHMGQCEPLTPTELQILRLICADKTNGEIAEIMGIKLPTVKTHVAHIFNKLKVKRRSEAKTAAIKMNL